MLAVLPAQFGQLTQLKCLDLSHNGISGIPAVCFMGLTQLEKLWLGGNALTSLGVDIGAMLSLRELHLSHNRLTALPPEIASLKQLKVLNVEDNSLVELPAHLSTIPFLNKLQVGSQNGCLRYAGPLQPVFVCFDKSDARTPTHTHTIGHHRQRLWLWARRASWRTWGSC